MLGLLGASEVFTVGFGFELLFMWDPESFNTRPRSLNKCECFLTCDIQHLIRFRCQWHLQRQFHQFLCLYRVKEVPYVPIESNIFCIFFEIIFRDIILVYRFVNFITVSEITFDTSVRSTLAALSRSSMIQWFCLIIRIRLVIILISWMVGRRRFFTRGWNCGISCKFSSLVNSLDCIVKLICV